MEFKQSNLPYLYETEDDVVTLTNGIERQYVWKYVVENAGRRLIDNDYHPVLVEQIRHKTRYRFDNYFFMVGNVHEWQYLDKPDEPYEMSILGYRVYQVGSISKEDTPYLQPEVAIMLGYSPDPKIIPTYLESTSKTDIVNVLTAAEELFADNTITNAWLSIPNDAPTNAPPEISRTMLHMRKDIGLKATRGRARMLQYIMKQTGVTLRESGWTLTPEELVRRKGVVIT